MIQKTESLMLFAVVSVFIVCSVLILNSEEQNNKSTKDEREKDIEHLINLPHGFFGRMSEDDKQILEKVRTTPENYTGILKSKINELNLLNENYMHHIIDYIFLLVDICKQQGEEIANITRYN